MTTLEPPIKDLPYSRGCLFLIKGITYELMVRHEVWNESEGKENYHYELKEHSKKDAKPFVVDHVYLYNTPKQISSLEIKPNKRWK